MQGSQHPFLVDMELQLKSHWNSSWKTEFVQEEDGGLLKIRPFRIRNEFKNPLSGQVLAAERPADLGRGCWYRRCENWGRKRGKKGFGIVG